jgi:hypothetical protein
MQDISYKVTGVCAEYAGEDQAGPIGAVYFWNAFHRSSLCRKPRSFILPPFFTHSLK